MAYFLATRGLVSPNADVISGMGRLIRTDYIWRKVMYISFLTMPPSNEILLTTSVHPSLDLTTSVCATKSLTATVQNEIALRSSVNATISLTVDNMYVYNVN